MRVFVLISLIIASMFTLTTQAASAPKSVVILQYHHVGADTPRVTSVTAEELDEQLAYLVENDFNIISLPEAWAALQGEAELPEKAVVLTFDDGWRNVYEEGRSVLNKYEAPYTIFVNPQLMQETPRIYMTWEQLREVEAEGAFIANHSNSHDHMTWRQDGESERQWRQRMLNDIEGAQAKIDEELGEQPRFFAYPYGEYNPELETLLEDLGYVAFGQHSGPWGEHSPTTGVPRFPASGNYAALDGLRLKLSSLPLPVTEVEHSSMIVDHEQAKPTLTATLENTDDFYRASMQCFIGGEVIKPEWDGNTFSVTPTADIGIGRSRFNCTVPSISASGQYYWYSQPWVRPDENGRWPD